MFQTELSPASRKANSLIGTETGLVKLSTVTPVLCIDSVISLAGMGIGLADQATSAVTNFAGKAVGQVADIAADAAHALGDAADNVGDFFSSVFYLPPGRMSAVDMQVTDDASVDELISASRGRAV